MPNDEVITSTPKVAVVRFDDENVLIIKHYLSEQVTDITLQDQKDMLEETKHINWWLA